MLKTGYKMGHPENTDNYDSIFYFFLWNFYSGVIVDCAYSSDVRNVNFYVFLFVFKQIIMPIMKPFGLDSWLLGTCITKGIEEKRYGVFIFNFSCNVYRVFMNLFLRKIEQQKFLLFSL